MRPPMRKSAQVDASLSESNTKSKALIHSADALLWMAFSSAIARFAASIRAVPAARIFLNSSRCVREWRSDVTRNAIVRAQWARVSSA